MSRKRASLRHDRRGAAVIEFALAAPVLLALLSGIVAYGGWFWMSHALQQAVNDAARATLAGINATERRSIAVAAVQEDLRRGAALDVGRATVTFQETSELVTVAVRYDAARSPFFAMTFVPMPPAVIRRTAVIRLSPA